MSHKNIKKLIKHCLSYTIGLFVFSIILTTVVTAAPDNELTYHGKLTDTTLGTAVADGNYNFTLSIYDSAANGTCLWTNNSSATGCSSFATKSVTITNGIFSTIIGESGVDQPLNLDFNDNYYLEVKIGTNSPMSPRRKITPTGFALNSHRLDGLTADNYIDTSSTAQTKAGGLTLGDDFTVHGNDLHVDVSTGRVGIGVTDPNAKLDVRGDAIFNEDGGDNDFRIEGGTVTNLFHLDASGDSIGIAIAPNVNTTLDIGELYPSITTNGANYRKVVDIIANDLSIASGVTESGYRIGLAIQGFTDDANFQGTLNSQYGIWSRVGSNTANPTGTIVNSYGIFLENLDGGANVTNKYGLYQDSTTAKNYFGGNVGIKTTSPVYPLVVNSGLPDRGNWLQIAKSSGTLDASDGLFVGIYGDVTDWGGLAIPDDVKGQGSIWMGNEKDITFFTENSGTGTASEKMRITNDGDFGIGTSSPNEKLQVDGAINIGTTANANAGTIRYLSNDFEGYNGSSWNSLTSAGAWAQSGGNVYRSSGNVGIGVATPADLLHINSSSGDASMIFTTDHSGITVSDGLYVGITQADDVGWIWNYENARLAFGTNNTERMQITATGNLIPSQTTNDLGSTLNRWNDLYLSSSSLHIGTNTNDGILSFDTTNSEFDFDKSLVVDTGTNLAELYIGGHVSSGNASLKLYRNNTISSGIEFTGDGSVLNEKFQIIGNDVGIATHNFFTGDLFTGNVGIGEINPSQALDVIGNLETSGYAEVSGGLRQNGNVVLNGTDTWLRTTGDTGWYSATHGGGWRMTDSTYIRNYGSKQVMLDNHLSIGSSATSGADIYLADRLIDWDSTGYYLDPNSTSRLYRADLNDVRSDIFYDRGNTAYYVNPAGTSRLDFLDIDSTASVPLRVKSSNDSGAGMMMDAGSGDNSAALYVSYDVVRISKYNNNFGTYIGNKFQFDLDTNQAYKTTSGTWAAMSDERLKTNIVNISGAEALEKITQLQGVNFDWRNPDQHGGYVHDAGFIAQDIEGVFPQWVSEIDVEGGDAELINGMAKSIYLPFEFDALIVEAVKEQNLTITSNTLQTDTNITNLSQLQNSVDENLANIQLSLTDLYEHNSVLSGQVDANTLAIGSVSDIKDRLEILEVGLDVVAHIDERILTIDPDALMFISDDTLQRTVIDEDGNETLQDITELTLNGIMTTQILKAQHIQTNTLAISDTNTQEDEDTGEEINASSIGAAEISTGETEVSVQTTAIMEDGHVFVTMRGEDAVDINLTVVDITDGMFRVSMPEVQATDVKFDWFIVGGVE